MAARGTTSKEAVINKILEVFPNAFQIDKEIRIPMDDPDSGVVQVKIVATVAAKNIEPPDGSEIVPTNLGTPVEIKPQGTFNSMTNKISEPSPAEQKRVDEWMKKMGLL